MKLVTRAQWGARDYRRPNGGIGYSRARRGVKLHYLGAPYADRPHIQCAAYVRRIQASHMDERGWSDIGYSFVVCTHGYVYEGRGLRRRNSANGNTSLNEECYAVLLLAGTSGVIRPMDAQLHGARDAIDYCRKEGPAGAWLGGHRDGYATQCPGDAIYAWVKRGAPRPDSEEDDMQLTDKVELKQWIKDRFPDDSGIQDGSIYVSTALASGYAHARTASTLARVAASNSEEILVQLKAQQATIDKLIDAVAAGPGVDLDAVKTEIRDAIEGIKATVRLDVEES
jgi:hypothetical protein